MSKKLKAIPKFKNENEERKFWDKADSSDYFDFNSARVVAFPNLRLTRKPISLRITESLLNKLKILANKKDVPYQSLMKIYLEKAVENDYKRLAV
ncbi:MAG: BrnA antitoxin family protein [Patescibacteria group bacterium]|nr:BrnA antitoxin family protein [Patescibacteria group bacterium]